MAKAQKREAPWPRGYRKVEDKLLKDGVCCVPTGLTGAVLRAQHNAAGHVGGKQLWDAASRHYQFANTERSMGAGGEDAEDLRGVPGV